MTFLNASETKRLSIVPTISGFESEEEEAVATLLSGYCQNENLSMKEAESFIRAAFRGGLISRHNRKENTRN